MSDSHATLYTIPPGAPFLRQLAHVLGDDASRHPLFGTASLHEYTIFLPTRRAVEWLSAELGDVVQTKTGRSALLLPRLIALGNVDETLSVEGFFAGEQDKVPMAVSQYRRQFYFLRALLTWSDAQGRPLSLAQATRVARNLSAFLDQAQADEINWQNLAGLVPDDLAENWQQTIKFLRLITQTWPDYLAQTQQLDPVMRRTALIEQVIKDWSVTPPAGPVIVAGSTGTVAMTRRLLNFVAHLPNGAVILPGLDCDAPDHVWESVMRDPTHPQTSMARLLQFMKVTRDTVHLWPGSPSSSARSKLMHYAMSPVEHTGNWQEISQKIEMAEAMQGLSVLEAPDPRAEAGAIAVMMREVLQTPQRTVALVTADRNLARRVAAELRRWDVEVNDSAGTALRQTAGADLILLALQAVADGLAPVALLSLLKHPNCCLNEGQDAHLSLTFALEALILRGPISVSGADSLKQAIMARADDLPLSAFPQIGVDDLCAFIDRLDAALAPLIQLRQEKAEAKAFFLALRQVIEALLGGENKADLTMIVGAREVFDLFNSIEEESELVLPASFKDWVELITMWLDSEPYFKPTGNADRLFIWGPLEARLLSTDLIILGGLNEGSWPPMAETGPWLSRPMRETMGMNQPERRIGLAAHDFVQNACAPQVVLSRAIKVDGTPTIAARWLRRLETLAGKFTSPFAAQRLAWWQALDQPQGSEFAPRPAPCPPREARPQRLWVTQVETLLRDPYRIYAANILNLREWDEVGAPATARHRGTFVHDMLEVFSAQFPNQLPENPRAELHRIAEQLFAAPQSAPHELAVWRPRLEAIIDWIIDCESKRRRDLTAIFAEVAGHLRREIGGEVYTISARADRIERARDGRYRLLDYKTGQLPSASDIKNMFSVQLTLEASILRAGGFETLGAALAHQFDYIRVHGGFPAGEVVTHLIDDRQIDEALAGLDQLVKLYRQESQPFISRLRPKLISFPSAYDHLARVDEWSTRGEDEQ